MSHCAGVVRILALVLPLLVPRRLDVQILSGALVMLIPRSFAVPRCLPPHLVGARLSQTPRQGQRPMHAVRKVKRHPS